jgi:hypothetical protein
MIKATYYTDPGHGWFAVKRDVLAKLGLLFDISRYSYQRGKMVYLEEDCDASLFFSRTKAMGIEVTYVTKHTDKTHPIRSYECYHNNVPTYYYGA